MPHTHATDHVIRRSRTAADGGKRATPSQDLRFMMFLQRCSLDEARNAEGQKNVALKCQASDYEGAAALIPAKTYEDLRNKVQMLVANVDHLVPPEHDTHGHRNLLRSLARDIIGETGK